MTVLTDLSNYLEVPFAYLLQEHSIEDLSNLRDLNKYSFLHCAVLSNNLNKVIEIINSNFPISTLTENSEIPFKLLKKFIPFDFSNSLNIVFSEQGYTAVHLNLFLLNYYSNFKPHKKEFTIQQFKLEQVKILDLFIEQDNDILSIQDKKGFTLFDYAFLFENISLINKFFKLDPVFNHLHFIKKETALKILDIIKIKQENNKNSGNIDKVEEEVIANLKKRMLFDKLALDLKHKNKVQSVNKI